MIHEIATGTLKTKFGDFKEYLFYDGIAESIALTYGDVNGREDVLCRVHSRCISAHVFNSIECDCREQMEIAQFRIQDAGAGLVIWLDQEGRGNGHMALLRSAHLRANGLTQTEAYVRLGYKEDARDYFRAGEILKHLGVKSIRLLTNNPKKRSDLETIGVTVSGTQQIQIDPTVNEVLHATYKEKLSLGHKVSI